MKIKVTLVIQRDELWAIARETTAWEVTTDLKPEQVKAAVTNALREVSDALIDPEMTIEPLDGLKPGGSE